MLKQHLVRLGALLVPLALNVFSPTVSAQTLLSQGKPVAASTQEGAALAASMAVDGNSGTRWGSVFADPQWITVDLGAVATINRVLLNWEAAYGKAYQIQVSDNGTRWTNIYSTANSDGGIDDIALSGTGRYVRMYGTARANGYGYSLWEFQVYGVFGSSASLLSRNAPVTASSQEGGFTAASAVDGNTGTRWGTDFSDAQWIYVDLDSSANISKVVLNWEAAYGKSYQIQVSDNATNWSTIYSTTNSDGGIDDITLSGTGRYVRMNGVARATGYGYSLWEFDVYGSRSGGTGSSSAPSSSSVAPPSSVASSRRSSVPMTSSSAPMTSSSVAPSSRSSSSSSSTGSDSSTVNFGSNVTIFDPAMPRAQMQTKINEIYERQRDNQFGTPRDAIMFKPGVYDLQIPVGFFTHVIGLGALPDDVEIIGQVVSYPVLPNNNSTQNFWRGIENFSVTPPDGGMLWSVSQAAPMRRMHVRNNNLILHYYGGWASGGWLADSKVDYDVGTGSQQQFVSRNCQWGSWTGSLWNMVFIGAANNLPGGTWPASANTFIDSTPVVREKPFLYLNGVNYEVFVPALRTNAKGLSWANGQSAGTSLPLSQFYIAHAGVDNATTINAALNHGKNLLLTPGIYPLADSIKVTRANTVVMGMGYATLTPTNGNSVLEVADVDGVTLSHLMVDAGTTNTPVLIRVGETGSNASHASNPTVLHDIFVRIGGNGVGRADVSLQVNSNDVIIDHTWLWRADHGDGVAWDLNTAANGLIVNGDNVSAYGLFVEHFQEYQVLWNGNNGKTYFYQSEIPYDPPTQDQWRSAAGVNGWASYKVADTVAQHDARGMGIYAVFLRPNVFLSRAIETPTSPNVKFQHMVTVNLTQDGGIQRVINNTGDATPPGVAVQTPRVTSYPQ